jgi:hypothetical protein
MVTSFVAKLVMPNKVVLVSRKTAKLALHGDSIPIPET